METFSRSFFRGTCDDRELRTERGFILSKRRKIPARSTRSPSIQAPPRDQPRRETVLSTDVSARRPATLLETVLSRAALLLFFLFHEFNERILVRAVRRVASSTEIMIFSTRSRHGLGFRSESRISPPRVRSGPRLLSGGGYTR